MDKMQDGQIFYGKTAGTLAVSSVLRDRVLWVLSTDFDLKSYYDQVLCTKIKIIAQKNERSHEYRIFKTYNKCGISNANCFYSEKGASIALIVLRFLYI
jgi:hypothetical protein